MPVDPGVFELAARALSFLRPQRGRVFFLFAITIVVALANAADPLILKYGIDDLQAGGSWRIVAAIGVIALLSVIREALGVVSNAQTWRVRLTMQHDLQGETVSRLHRLPMNFFRNEPVGQIMTRIDRGVNGVVDVATQLAFTLPPSALYLLFAIVAMVELDWRLAAVVLVLAPLPLAISMRFAPQQTQRERTLLDRWMKIYARFNQVIHGILTVKSFTREDEEKNRFVSAVDEANGIVLHGVWFDSRVGAMQNMVTVFGRLLTLALGGYLVVRHQITLGTLVAFLGYVGGVFGPVLTLTSVYRAVRTSIVPLETVSTVINAADVIVDSDDARELVDVRGEIRFERVRFSYGSDHAAVLEDVDLDVRAGEMLAIVGPSGSGKSTLIGLLQRFYDPTGGRVTIDGNDIRDITMRSLREQIGVVLQEPLLFDESVRENIAYARPWATEEEIENAARAAGAHEFIMRLAGGYDATVGERGSRLSAGERQRIAIARMLLKNPRIIILDEATSALDAETEAAIQEALERVTRGRTTFVVAHRLSTVVRADRVAVLRDGRILEIGSHEELLERGAYYASLVQHQIRGLLPERWRQTRRRGPHSTRRRSA